MDGLHFVCLGSASGPVGIMHVNNVTCASSRFSNISRITLHYAQSHGITLRAMARSIMDLDCCLSKGIFLNSCFDARLKSLFQSGL